MGTPITLAAAGVGTSDINRPGGTVWAETTEILYNYLRRDMSDFEEHRRRVYKRTHQNHVLKTVPFVYRLARELATFYVRDPTRTYRSSDGSPVDPVTAASVSDLNQDSSINSAMRFAQEQLVALGNATVWVWPSTATGSVRIICPPPHMQAVELLDPMGSEERDVAAWYVKMAVSQDPSTGIVSYAVARITASSAIWSDGPPDLKGKGVWTEDGSNPIGVIPAVRMRSADPAPGQFWAPVNADLLDAQRAVCHDFTDMGLVAKLQSHGQAVITGMRGQESEIEIGPETIIGLPDPDQNFEIVASKANLDGYLKVSESYLQTIIATNGLNPQTVLKSSGITAVAKQVELADREIERRRHLAEFKRCEQMTFDFMRLFQNWIRGQEIIKPAKVEVAYREPYMPADPLHEAQKAERMIAMGITSAAKELAKMEGVDLETAKTMVRENLQETADVMPDAEPTS